MPSARSQVSARSVWVVGLNVLAIAGTVWACWQTWSVISWILIALFIAVALHPLVDFLSRHGMSHGLAVATVFIGLITIVVILVKAFVPMFVDQGRALVQNAPGYIQDLRQHEWVIWADQRFGLLDRVENEVKTHGAAFALPLLGIVSHVLVALVEMITVLTLTLFMLLFGEDLFERAIMWFRPERRTRISLLAHRMTDSVGGYMAGTFFISAMAAVVNGVALAILGVPYFLPIALAMLLLGVIPWVGPAISMVLIFMSAAATVGFKKAIIALAIMQGWKQIEHRIAPLVQSRTVKMNALLLAIVALLGTALAGVLGAVLAVPVAGAIQVIAQDVLKRRQERWIAARREEHAAEQLKLPMALPGEQEPPSMVH